MTPLVFLAALGNAGFRNVRLEFTLLDETPSMLVQAQKDGQLYVFGGVLDHQTDIPQTLNEFALKLGFRPMPNIVLVSVPPAKD